MKEDLLFVPASAHLSGMTAPGFCNNRTTMEKSLFILAVWLMACPSWMIGQERMLRHEVRISRDAIGGGHHLTLAYGISKGRNTFEIGPRFLLNRPIEDRVYYAFRNRMRARSFDEHLGLYAGYSRTLFQNPISEIRAFNNLHASYSRIFLEASPGAGVVTDPNGNLQPVFYNFGFWTERIPHANTALGLELKLRVWKNLWISQRAAGEFSLSYNKVFHEVEWQPMPMVLGFDTWAWSFGYQLGVGLSYRW